MKTIIVILAALISTNSFCQSSDSLTETERKAAIEYLQKKLPSHYQNIPMVYKEKLTPIMDSLDANSFIYQLRCYTFDNTCICDSAVVMAINVPGNNGRFPRRNAFIYYKVNRKNSEYIGAYMVTGE